jgi:hypothetical protein
VSGESIVAFLTSKTGIIAAVTAVVALISAIFGLVRPALDRRRVKAEARADLRMANFKHTPPTAWSAAARSSFELVNAGKGKAILASLELEVLEHGEIPLPKMTIEAAPLAQFLYKVELRPGVDRYDVRKKEFGSAPPHSYAEGEAESIVVELRTTQPQWYQLQFVLRWYDARHPGEMRELRSSPWRTEFEPTIEDVIMN